MHEIIHMHGLIQTFSWLYVLMIIFCI